MAFVCNGRFTYHYSLALEFVKAGDKANKAHKRNSNTKILISVKSHIIMNNGNWKMSSS